MCKVAECVEGFACSATPRLISKSALGRRAPLLDVSLSLTALTFGKLDPNSLAPAPRYKGRAAHRRGSSESWRCYLVILLTFSLDEIAADEFWAMRVIKEERECRERETGGT
jgi:hypothetical protein